MRPNTRYWIPLILAVFSANIVATGGGGGGQQLGVREKHSAFNGSSSFATVIDGLHRGLAFMWGLVEVRVEEEKEGKRGARDKSEMREKEAKRQAGDKPEKRDKEAKKGETTDGLAFMWGLEEAGIEKEKEGKRLARDKSEKRDKEAKKKRENTKGEKNESKDKGDRKNRESSRRRKRRERMEGKDMGKKDRRNMNTKDRKKDKTNKMNKKSGYHGPSFIRNGCQDFKYKGSLKDAVLYAGNKKIGTFVYTEFDMSGGRGRDCSLQMTATFNRNTAFSLVGTCRSKIIPIIGGTGKVQCGTGYASISRGKNKVVLTGEICSAC